MMLYLKDLTGDGNFSVTGGSDNPQLTGIAPAMLADKDEIAIAYNKREIKNTKARVILTKPVLYRTEGKLLLFSTQSVGEAAVELAKLFIAAGVYSDYSKPLEYTIDSNLVRYGQNCLIAETAHIESFVSIGDNAVIGDNCYIGENVTIGSDVVIGNDVVLKPGCRIGTPAFYYYSSPQKKLFSGIGTVIIGDGVSIGTNTVIQRGGFSNTVIGDGTAIGDLVMVGHDVVIGDNCLIVSQSGIAGGASLEDNVRIYGQCGISEKVCIGKGVKVHGKTAVWKDVPAGMVISGAYGREYKRELRINRLLEKMIPGSYGREYKKELRINRLPEK